MKTIQLLTLFITIPFLLTGMNDEPSPKQKPFSLCRRLKTINPNAPQQNYEELAQVLLDADLSACECVQHLIEAKQEKRLKKMVEENIISKKYYDKINHLRRTNFDYKPSLIVHLPEREFLDAENILEKDIVPSFSQHSITIGNFNEMTATLAEVKRKKAPTKVEKSTKDHLYLGSYFFVLSSDARKGALLHEKEHLKGNHTPINKSIHQSIKENGTTQSFFKNARLRYFRSQEAEADRVPAACGSCDDARSLIEFFHELSNKGFMDLDKTTKSIALYPSDYKRYAWAQRIYRLKVAEEFKKEK